MSIGQSIQLDAVQKHADFLSKTMRPIAVQLDCWQDYVYDLQGDTLDIRSGLKPSLARSSMRDRNWLVPWLV